MSTDPLQEEWSVRPLHLLTATYALGVVISLALLLDAGITGGDSDRFVFAGIGALAAWCLFGLRWYRVGVDTMTSRAIWPRARFSVGLDDIRGVEPSDEGRLSRLYPEYRQYVFSFLNSRQVVVPRSYVNSERLFKLLRERLNARAALDIARA